MWLRGIVRFLERAVLNAVMSAAVLVVDRRLRKMQARVAKSREEGKRTQTT
jgi:hypothetical protein